PRGPGRRSPGRGSETPAPRRASPPRTAGTSGPPAPPRPGTGRLASPASSADPPCGMRAPSGYTIGLRYPRLALTVSRAEGYDLRPAAAGYGRLAPEERHG